MSMIHRLKSQIKHQRTGQSPYPNVIGGGQEVVVLPEKPKKRRKLMEVQRESKVTLDTLPGNKGGCERGGDDGDAAMDDEDEEDDDEAVKKEPKKVPWGPSEILDHLKDPATVGNIHYVIDQLKKDTPDEEGRKIGGGGGDPAKDKKGQPIEIVWDHSATKEGKKSDNNFFIWFEAMAAGEARKVMAQENLLFE
jgi:hypothetical protein